MLISWITFVNDLQWEIVYKLRKFRSKFSWNQGLLRLVNEKLLNSTKYINIWTFAGYDPYFRYLHYRLEIRHQVKTSLINGLLLTYSRYLSKLKKSQQWKMKLVVTLWSKMICTERFTPPGSGICGICSTPYAWSCNSQRKPSMISTSWENIWVYRMR